MHNLNYSSFSALMANEEACADAAADAAAAFETSALLAQLDDEESCIPGSQPGEPQPSSSNVAILLANDSIVHSPFKRASGGAENNRFRDLLQNDLALSDSEDEEDASLAARLAIATEGTAIAPVTEEPVYAELQSVRVLPVAEDIQFADNVQFHESSFMDTPSTSHATPDYVAEPSVVDPDDWAEYYYELSDPHADLIDKIRADMLKTAKIEKEVDEKFTATMIEKAAQDMLHESNKKKAKYVVPGKAQTPVYVCFICSHGFLDVDKMKDHIQKAHLSAGGNRDFKCRFCDRLFMRRRNVLEHENKHLSGGVVYPCTECPKSYSSEILLEHHLSDAHSLRANGSKLGKKRFNCEFCEKAFGLARELKYHQYYCAKADEIKAKRAQKKAVERDAMAKMVYDEEPSLRLPASVGRVKTDKSCPFCGLICASAQSRDRHVSRKHKDEPMPLKEQKIRSPTVMHVPTPEQLVARPFMCTTCSAVFTTKAALSIHTRRVHEEDSTIKKFPCEKCGKIFPLMSELRKHAKQSEGLPMCRGRGRAGMLPNVSGALTPASSGASQASSPALSVQSAPVTPYGLMKRATGIAKEGVKYLTVDSEMRHSMKRAKSEEGDDAPPRKASKIAVESLHDFDF